MNEHESYLKRIQQLKNIMDEKKIDLVIAYSDVWRSGNVQFFTGWWSTGGGIDQAASFLIVTKQNKPILSVGYEQVNEVKRRFDFLEAERSNNLENILNELKSGIKKIGIIGMNIIPQSYYQKIKNALSLGGNDIEDLNTLINEWKLIKDDWEIVKIKKSSEISDNCIKEAISGVNINSTEIDIMSAGLQKISSSGALPSFYPVVSFGKNSHIPMRFPCDEKLDGAGLILLDFGAKYDGFAGDISRTISYGNVSDKESDLLKAAIEANVNVKDIIKPGIKSWEVNAHIVNTIKRHGFGEYIEHPSSHGVGMDHEEAFPLSPDDYTILQENMVFTIEAGIYVPNLGGARIEDVILVTADGCESMNKVDRELFI